MTRRLLVGAVAVELVVAAIAVTSASAPPATGPAKAGEITRAAVVMSAVAGVAEALSNDAHTSADRRSAHAEERRSNGPAVDAPAEASNRAASSMTLAFAAPRDFATGAPPSSVAFHAAFGDQLIPPSATHLPLSNSVAVGDFDEDGHDDVVETNVLAGSMSVFLADGNGRFAAPRITPVGGLPSFVVAGRLDLDDHLDLAVADLGSSDIAIFHGDGDGGFGLADRIPLPGPRHIAVGDLEGDGMPDLAVASAGPACPANAAPCASMRSPAGAVIILGGVREPLGTVTFRVTQVLTHTSTLDGQRVSPGVVALVDLNGDGQDDVVASSGYRSNAGDELPGGGITGDDVFVHLHRPRAPGAVDPFDEVPSQPGVRVGAAPEGIAVGDFDRDSHPDVAVLGSRSGDVTTLLGSARGHLTATERNASVGMLPRSLVTADLDGDGLLDLVTAGFGSSTVCVLIGRGDGTFAASIDHWVGDEPTSVAVGQFDDDRRPDVVAGRIRDDALSLLRNRGHGPGDGVVISRDLPYLPVAGDRFAAHHTIDLYEPPRGMQSFAGRGKPYPVLVFFHGGAIVTNETMYSLLMRRLASDGIFVASAGYRLDAEATRTPDVAAALRWVIAHASDYGADPAELTIMGYSAGGFLAMQALASPENLDILGHVKAFVATSGVAADGARDAHTVASRRDGDRVPPRLLLINGTEGFELALVGQSVIIDAALRADGADSRQCVFAGRDHVTTTARLALDDDPARRALMQFLRAKKVDCPI